jgi:sugar O-acyltransferase (sialic acid O-acetyltransferase NeuD family)
MIIIGAKGHAKDILSVLTFNEQLDNLYFFDDLNSNLPDALYGIYPILKSEDEVNKVFKSDNNFAIGIGSPEKRYHLSVRFIKLGGTLNSIVSNTATIGLFDIRIGSGVNIMANTVLTNSIYIGDGVLINAGALIHHDVSIGRYTEISPGAIIAGGVCIGDFSSIGLGAKLLSKIKIGSNVIIGAGAVVTKDIEDNSLAVGIPAKVIKRLEPLTFR